MVESVKDITAKMLADWLFKDFGILIDEPTSKDIEAALEEYEENLDEKR